MLKYLYIVFVTVLTFVMCNIIAANTYSKEYEYKTHLNIKRLHKKHTMGESINIVILDTNYPNKHGYYINDIISNVAPASNVEFIDYLDEKHQFVIVEKLEKLHVDITKGKRVDVLNLSLAFSNDSVRFKEAIKSLYNDGVIIVCASGNDSKRQFYPSLYTNEDIVISVGSYINRKDKTITGYTSIPYDLLAPCCVWYQDGTRTGGTSISCAYVTGLLAVMQLDIEKVKKYLGSYNE